MERNERQQLRAITDEVARWVDGAHSVLSYRAKIDGAGNDAVDKMRRAVVPVRGDGEFGWRIMLVRPGDSPCLSDIARQNHLPPMSAEDKVLASLTTQAAAAPAMSKRSWARDDSSPAVRNVR